MQSLCPMSVQNSTYSHTLKSHSYSHDDLHCHMSTDHLSFHIPTEQASELLQICCLRQTLKGSYLGNLPLGAQPPHVPKRSGSSLFGLVSGSLPYFSLVHPLPQPLDFGQNVQVLQPAVLAQIAQHSLADVTCKSA